VLHGWGNYFATGNAVIKFVQIDGYVRKRLVRLLVKRKGRNLRPEQVEQWTRQWFVSLGLRQLMGTIRYPGTA
jgi:RNA-directed DNA polymerase